MPVVPRWRLLQQLGSDYAGLRDTSALASRMVDAKEYRKRRRSSTASWRRSAQRSQNATANRRHARDRPPTRSAPCASTRSGNATDNSAKRIINTLLAQTGFYLPREMTERGEFARDAYFLEIAVAIKPESDAFRKSLEAVKAKMR